VNLPLSEMDKAAFKAYARLLARENATRDWRTLAEYPFAGMFVAPDRKAGRRFERHWQIIGLGGFLAQFLNSRGLPMKVSAGVRLEGLRDELWALLVLAQEKGGLGLAHRCSLALTETRHFLNARLNWQIHHCQHGRHYFIADYRMRNYCPAHGQAGAKAAQRRLQQQLTKGQ
jgi:hypothetical protein